MSQHFMLKRSNGRHFLFKKSSRSALYVYEVQWPSTLYSRYPVVSNSYFRGPVGQHFRFKM